MIQIQAQATRCLDGFGSLTLLAKSSPRRPFLVLRRSLRPVTLVSSRVSTMQAKASSEGQAVAATDVSADSIILEPTRDAGADLLLVFAPGALTAAKEYIPLATLLQSSSELRLWVVILNPPGNVISTEITDGSFDGVIERVKALGFKPGQLAMDNVFLAGHSWGAWTARTVALRRAQAFIQMGSCFHTTPDNLSQYPKPVLTLNGELDGQLTLAATAKHAGEIFNAEAEMGSFNTYGVKPVIHIPGMNHAQSSHGIPNRDRGDLDAEISIDQARRIVAELVAAFLAVQVEGSSAVRSLKKLEDAVKKTQKMCRSYWEAISEQESKKQVKQYQLQLAGLPTQVMDEPGVGVVEHEYKDNFIYSKPWIDKQQQKVFVQTYLNPYGKYGLVRSLWLKMKSREAMRASFLDDNDSEKQGGPRTAAEFNEKTFAEALKLVPEDARKKYLERGKQVEFLDDLIISDSSMKWIKSDLAVKVGVGSVKVQSPVLVSPVQGIAPRFAGMHYMKLLTTAGAMEIVLTDSFRQ